MFLKPLFRVDVGQVEMQPEEVRSAGVQFVLLPNLGIAGIDVVRAYARHE